MKKQLLLLTLLASSMMANAQSITEKYQRFLTDPQTYVVYRAQGDIKVDGVLDEPDWQKAPVINHFVDISGEDYPTPRFTTNAKILWDDNYLYIAGDLQEPNVWADIKNHDEVVYNNHDFEVFIDPDGDGQNYFEIETNAIGTVFDLLVQKPYRAPKRTFATFSWDTPGLKIDTHITGTLNNASDKDKGWTVEMAIPRTAIAAEFDNYLLAGNYMRLGFSRVEWQTETNDKGVISKKKDANGKALAEDNWTWGSTGQVAMHMPERWGYIYLSPKTVGNGTEEFKYPKYRNTEKLLWAMFYAQEEQKSKTGAYLKDVKQFKLTPAETALLPEGAKVKVETTSQQYDITVTTTDGNTYSIDENGLFTRSEKAPSVKAYGWSGWNPEEVSEDSLRTMFTEWKRHGLVGVCMECHFDLERTARCAAIAHEVGLEYHAWAPSMLQGGMPESWYTVNRLGKSAYNPKDRAYVEYYQTIDPHNPEVIRYMVEQYTALAAVPNVDYVQFDYIRYADAILSEGLWEKYANQINHQWRTDDGVVHEYPVADYCYCDACCADFKAKTGIDIKAKLKEGVDPQTIKEWAQFRCDNVTNLVNTVCKAVHAKGGKLSADVFPGPKSHAEWMVRQQWNNWDIDMVFPMNYNNFYMQGPDWLYTITKEEVESINKPVMSGLMICRDWQNRKSLFDPENTGLIPSELNEAISGAVKAGAAGVCLFTPQSMTDEHWKEFEKAIK